MNWRRERKTRRERIEDLVQETVAAIHNKRGPYYVNRAMTRRGGVKLANRRRAETKAVPKERR